MTFYAVAKGKTPGIYNTWGECQAQVNGCTKPRFKKFNNIKDAEQFISNEQP